jgi:uncharacterized protein
MNTNRNALRLNVGFLINQSVGSSRDFIFDYPELPLSPDLELSDIKGSARITRTAQGLLVQVKMHASITTECSRCLTEMQQPLAVEYTELYAFSPRAVSESGLILPEDGHIDLAPLLQEYMYLEIPINPICRPDCRGLCPVCGELLGEKLHTHDNDPIDPRLAALRSLLEDNP